MGFETDLVSREIVRGKLLAVADEMGVVLKRSSMSPVIYEVLDFACGFCDSSGQLVSQTNGITVFTGTFSIQTGIILEKFGDQLEPGDIYIMNNPFEGGTHYNDVGIVKPIFVDVLPDQNMNPHKIESLITKKTKAIMPVHLTGRSCDMSSIMKISRKYNLSVIEDNIPSQSLLLLINSSAVSNLSPLFNFTLKIFEA